MHTAARRVCALTLALLPTLLVACGTAKPMPAFDSFQHRVTDGTVALYWNCSRPAPGVVRVEGVANNPYSPTPLEDLELRLYGVTAQGANVSRARGSTKDYLIETNFPSAFSMDLKTRGGEVRYDLVYSYMLAGEMGGAGRMAGGGAGGGGEQQNMARDICASLAP